MSAAITNRGDDPKLVGRDVVIAPGRVTGVACASGLALRSGL